MFKVNFGYKMEMSEKKQQIKDGFIELSAIILYNLCNNFPMKFAVL